jgi:hypothetical protein
MRLEDPAGSALSSAVAPSPQPSPPSGEWELLPLPLAGEGWGEGLMRRGSREARWSN